MLLWSLYGLCLHQPCRRLTVTDPRPRRFRAAADADTGPRRDGRPAARLRSPRPRLRRARARLSERPLRPAGGRAHAGLPGLLHVSRADRLRDCDAAD